MYFNKIYIYIYIYIYIPVLSCCNSIDSIHVTIPYKLLNYIVITINNDILYHCYHIYLVHL